MIAIIAYNVSIHMLKYIHYRANNVHPYITGKLEDQKTQLGEKKKKRESLCITARLETS